MSERPSVIAETPELLTAEWLSAALLSSGAIEGGAVVSVESRPLGTGQMCDSLRVTPQYRGPVGERAPGSLVAKLPAADPTSRATAISLQNYVKEVRFYQELAGDLPVRTPEVFYADIDDEGGCFVLLLEDMQPSEQGDQLAGCSPDAARGPLSELSRLHAPRWGDASLSTIDWLHGDPEAGRQFMLELLPTLWHGFSDRYADRLTDAIRTTGTQLFEHHLDAYLDPGDGPMTITHGDFRLDNLLFHPEADEVAVVDWQTCSIGAAGNDVAYFLGAGLLVEDRRPHEEQLVRHYHAELTAAGIDFGWEECWTAYRRGTFAGLIVAVAASMLVERTDRGDDMFMAMASRHAQHALDLDGIGVVVAKP